MQSSSRYGAAVLISALLSSCALDVYRIADMRLTERLPDGGTIERTLTREQVSFFENWLTERRGSWRFGGRVSDPGAYGTVTVLLGANEGSRQAPTRGDIYIQIANECVVVYRKAEYRFYLPPMEMEEFRTKTGIGTTRSSGCK